MTVNRRAVLAGMASLGFLPLCRFAQAAEQPAFLACRQEADGSNIAAVFDLDGRILFSVPLERRGHDAALTPDRRTAVVFARRPDRFAMVIDVAGRKRRLVFTPPEDRHFYGHGFFSPDGRLLYATENDFDGERGVLGVYDAGADFARIGEIDAGGIGPHQALMMSDGRTIAIANGGLATHPDFPRMKLNLATMEPCLAYVDAETGDLVDRVVLPSAYRQMSIRHLTEAGDGSVWFGGQYEGPKTDEVELVGSHRRGGEARVVSAAPAIYRNMNHYIGAMATSPDGRRVASTSPRGGTMVVFDVESRAVLAERAVPDTCGLTGFGSGFVYSDGRGHLWRDGALVSEDPRVAWDNHIQAFALPV
ncbi:DUF1513 domain-containing protein [Amorphus orientalis]|uniref:DUF1513 domain-containing protein n=1 Tax=Amorphus orientalis TaxID=649198 RepID=A0AAE3VKN6_9HYPH|nr:DUF1513 domain-containing protein [Amorphus orientalis]MDQ0313688.1 hypothetical protein [Amorphus orientalis]